jgi:hypothetical protein
MVKKFDEIKNDPEYAALQDIEGIDAAELVKQAGGEPDPVPPVPDPVPPVPGQPDPVPPVPDPVPPVPPVPDPIPPIPGQDPVPPVPSVADPAPTPQGDMLKEIFGDRFKTVDEAKNANIVGLIDEVEGLRQAKTDLETKLESKPKTNFANDEVALYNEFVKETGTHDYGVFNKINSAEVATMEPMEALITKYVLDHPEQSGKEPQIRKYFEKKYNVDPEQVDDAELEVNKLPMVADGATAKKALQELKDKLKVPEIADDPSTPKELTPEAKATLESGWNSVGQNVSTALAKLQVPIKNGKEALLDYEISESEKKEIAEFVKGYAVENQMELNETNVKTISTMVYSQLMINKLPEIVHSVFEKARGLTEEEVHAIYANPSPDRNTDAPPVPPTPPQSEEEKMQDEIYNAEIDAYNK